MNGDSGVVEILGAALRCLVGATSISASRYFYRTGRIVDPRIVHHLAVRTFEEECAEIVEGLRLGEELAVHSSLICGGLQGHLALVDTSLLVSEQSYSWARVCELLGAFRIELAMLVESGAASHVYGFGLLSETEWRRFMASLLILRNESGAPIGDSRWVGHRLLAGYGALRVSAARARGRASPRVRWVGFLDAGVPVRGISTAASDLTAVAGPATVEKRESNVD